MEDAGPVAQAPFPGKRSAPREGTTEAARQGLAASLLLHLLVGAAMIVALSGPPRSAPTVIDLTLLPPAENGRRPVPQLFAATDPARDPGTAVLQEPPALPASQPAANPPDVTAPGNPSDPAAKKAAAAPGSPTAPDATLAAPSDTTGQGPVKTAAVSPRGTSGPGSPGTADFTWIRDAIQHAIAYPATARRMGWEGKVVVAFQLLPDGSVREVRVVQGSGHAVLDRGAIDAVRNASPFPRSPVEAEVITPVVYRLTTR
jgi:protein TonB